LGINFFQIAFGVVGIIGFGMSFVLQFRLRDHISLEKVRAVENPKELYPNSVPPKSVLNEKGLRLYRLFQLGFALFFGSIVMVAISGILSH